jgi:site-specific DNA-methyltransferase (adenine-specific)
MAKQSTKISDLIADDKNFNKGSEFGNSLIEKSFRKFGAGRSILIDKNNRIIAGNKSVENAMAIGMEDVQIIESDGTKIIAVKRTDIDLDSEQGREMALADNASAKANIVFDAEVIEAELGEAVCVEWGIELAKEEPEAEEDEFDVPEGGMETDIVLGDLFEIGEHRLLCGDSTDSDQVAKLMNGQKADMVFTDPPYGVNYSGRGKNTSNTIENDNLSLKETEEMVFGALTNAFIFSREGATIFVWHADSKPGLRPLFEKAFLESGWGLRATIIWQKKQASMGFADYRSQHEPCLYGWKGIKKERLEDRTQTTLWEGGRDQNYVHPTQKPLFLCETAIKNHNPILLIDLFLGSGSTMAASHQLKRKCYGMELDPKYCQVIIDRMKKLDPTLKIKRNGQHYEVTIKA